VRSILFGDRFDFLHLGGGSANTSAALIACALVSCAWFALQPRRRWQWSGLLLGIALSVLLVATKSRGGLIAAICGLGLVCLVVRPRIRKGFLIVSGVALLVLVVYGSMRGVWHRFTYGDDSRSDLWRAGLAMLWDAPGGVGAGNASNFFAQWYQETDDRRGYLSLINYHLDWLASRGLVARLGYVLAWAGLAWFVWPKRDENPARPAVTPYLTITAAGVWLTFFVAAIFSTTANVWQTWAFPLAWLVAVAIWRFRHRSFASARTACLCAGAGLLALAALHGVGWYLSSPQLSTRPHVVLWGEEPAKVVIYSPDSDVLGTKWGHDLRLSGESACVLYPGAEAPADLGPDVIWILSGKLPESVPPKSHLRLFNIPATPKNLEWLSHQAAASVRVTLSESLCRDLRCEDWFAWSDQHLGSDVKVMGGVNLFIPSWSWFDDE
jgi:hypothetical protein